ncbi:MAG: DUF1934 domain-containing protein [Clostridiales bacterium]|nr:DUF1934 domain-containing protein [Clostridiales bacterium]
MIKNILLKIQGSQELNSEKIDSVELTTPGTIEYLDEGCKIVYEESELTGMKGTTTTIIVDKSGRVTLNREGTTNSCLVFEEGQRHMSYYDIGEGAFTISVYTEYLEADINKIGGEIEIEYVLEIDNKVMGSNNIRLEFEYVNGDY